MKQSWIMILVLLLGVPSFSYEVDNFSDRNLLKSDSLPILDARINKILNRAVRDTQKEVGNYCNMAILRQEILRWIRPDPTGQLEVWIELSDEIDHTHVGINESIYQDASFIEAPVLKVVGIGRSLLVNGQIIGSDKVGHFFFQGLGYYDLVKEGKPLEKVLTEDHGEDGVWGLATSGIKSYADLAANYQGFRFWSQLTAGARPYVRCDEQKGWVIERSFTWADYVNPAWDEALNCSEMRPAIQAKVDLYLQKKGWRCPLEPDACFKISQLDHAEYFISPKCAAMAQSVFKTERKIAAESSER